MVKNRLSSSDKEFFAIVTEEAFTNPFSDKRKELDKKLLGEDVDYKPGNIRESIFREMQRRLDNLDSNGAITVLDYTEKDRELLQYFLLFHAYFRFAAQCDDHIEKQIKQGNHPIKAPFATELFQYLISRKFSEELASKYVSLLFQLRRAFYFINQLAGESPCMQTLKENLWNNIFTSKIKKFEEYLWDRMEDFSTLILGPTGSGKGAVAAAIGRSGFIPFDLKRKAFVTSFCQSFVSINLSQYPETLLESELFGYSKGAFTGAVAPHQGVFSLCGQNGSIFLDEIGDVALQTQIKLLQVLQERHYTPLGSHEKVFFRGRVIAATNKSIDTLRKEGKFRDDFYYRLCSDIIEVPSLKERIEESPQELKDLVLMTVEKTIGQQNEELIESVLTIIRKNLGVHYPWSGNVRELEQCVRRIIVKDDYRGDNLDVGESGMDELKGRILSGTMEAQDLMAEYCALLFKKYKTYEKVALISKLDRRTVKKHIENYSRRIL